MKSDKPVVLVCSMRPATGISADGPMNLYNGVVLAGSPAAKGRGPLVMINDTIHHARERQKMHTTVLNPGESPNRGGAGVKNTGRLYFYSMNTTAPRHQERVLAGRPDRGEPALASKSLYSYANLGGEDHRRPGGTGREGHRAGRRG